ncbi:MAG: helix-turn-helix transcriptional regulator [Gemmatimonadota bacterium]|nr:helix-turn-helix transcriptional regulator [Gemmatimonadota bacterium]
MDILQTTRTPAVLEELGRRIERLRLRRNLSLAQLAEEAGVGTATLQRLESGSNPTVKTLVQVLRALHRLADLDALVQEVEVSPFEISEGRRTPRRRASGSRG